MSEKKKNESLELLKAAKGQVDVLPGDTLPPGVEWHVCPTQPQMGATNLEGVCAVCGCRVYHGDKSPPGSKKICTPCTTKLYEAGEDLYAVTTENALARAALNRFRN